EVELLPEPRQTMRYVSLAILSKVSSIRIYHRRGIVVNAGHFFFVDRNDHRHPMLARELAHELRRRPIRYALYEVVPVRVLLGREVRTIEELLQADDLTSLTSRVLNHRDVFVDHRLLYCGDRAVGRFNVRGLYQSAFYYSWHDRTPYKVLMIPGTGQKVR